MVVLLQHHGQYYIISTVCMLLRRTVFAPHFTLSMKSEAIEKSEDAKKTRDTIICTLARSGEKNTGKRHTKKKW